MPKDTDPALKFYHRSAAPSAGMLEDCVISEMKMAGQTIKITGDTIEECMQKAREYEKGGHYY